jgi:YVTN family beta-propeller protein
MSTSGDSDHRVVVEVRWNRRGLFAIMAILTVLLLLGTWLAVSASTSSVITTPDVVSYQGRVTVNSSPFTGTGYFKFSIVNTDGTAAYWSNDGTGLATTPFTPTASVALSVTNGLFNVLLGDTSLSSMTQSLAPDIFAAPDRALRVWFNDGVNGFQQLTPDVRIASVPYAFNAELARTTQNLNCIALLRWNTSACGGRGDFPVGSGPSAVAFDGSKVWVANSNDGTLSVLRVADGSLVMTVTAGITPTALAFDSAKMWVANQGSNTVSAFRVSDGSLVGTYSVGSAPQGIAYDNANMWVTNSNDGTVSVLRASDGNLVGTYSVGGGPRGIAFDGTNMWVANYISNTVSVLRASDGSPLATIVVGSGPYSLAFDGTYMWVTNYFTGTVSIMRASTFGIVQSLPINNPVHNPTGLAFDGLAMWVIDSNQSAIKAMNHTSGGAIVVSYRTFEVGSNPQGVAFDGVNLWIANYNSNTVSKR